MEKNSKILTGCGIGCGAVVIILIIIGIIGYNFVSDKVEKIEEFETVINDLEDQYENYDQYSPEENLLSEERFAIFMEIRDSIKIMSPDFTYALSTISIKMEDADENEDKDNSFSEVLTMVNTGFSAIPEILEYFNYRHKMLEKYNMSVGEYYYYFTMTYYVSLGVDLGDGPNFPVPGNTDGSHHHFGNESSNSTEDFINDLRESRSDKISNKINHFMLKVFDNYLQNENQKYKKLIEEEIELMKEDKYKLPFAEAKPDFIKKFFEPYSGKIKTTYVEMLNPLELNPFTISKKRKSSKRKSRQSESY
ncbi:MAG: hypothetical protein ACEPO8_15710 [Rhodothermaceae bacterium]